MNEFACRICGKTFPTIEEVITHEQKCVATNPTKKAEDRLAIKSMFGDLDELWTMIDSLDDKITELEEKIDKAIDEYEETYGEELNLEELLDDDDVDCADCEDTECPDHPFNQKNEDDTEKKKPEDEELAEALAALLAFPLALLGGLFE